MDKIIGVQGWQKTVMIQDPGSRSHCEHNTISLVSTVLGNTLASG